VGVDQLPTDGVDHQVIMPQEIDFQNGALHVCEEENPGEGDAIEGESQLLLAPAVDALLELAPVSHKNRLLEMLHNTSTNLPGAMAPRRPRPASFPKTRFRLAYGPWPCPRRYGVASTGCQRSVMTYLEKSQVFKI
jgi:hypothetical protein